MWLRRPVPDLVLLLLLLWPSAALAVEVQRIDRATRWSGEVRLAGPVTVAPAAVLEIAPGTRVRPLRPEVKIVVQGKLLVTGSAARPVLFEPDSDWQGIEFIEAAPGSRLSHVRFRKAKAALASIATDFQVSHAHFEECGIAIKLLREAAPLIEESRFVANEIGVDNEMKSAPTIRGNHFEKHTKTALLASHNSRGRIEGNSFIANKQGIAILQKYSDEIVGNRFIDNQDGIFCNQTQNTPRIADNTFERNNNALVSFTFSYPLVENNRFIDNQTAIRNDQFGSPGVFHNLFRGNGTALHNYRKANPKVERNSFENNELALFCDYSSYPRVKDNNFLGNRMGVKLGIFQSADWEKRAGSKTIVQQQAQARRSQNPLLAQAPTEFDDYVDVTGNYWGEATAQLERAGGSGDVAMFHDRVDQPEVSYEGYGTASYRLDRVHYQPWLSEPVTGAGPR